jgi:hypothetical protein
MSSNPSSLDPQKTFRVEPQAGRVDAQAAGMVPSMDEPDPLKAARPDIGIQIRDIRQDKPPCFDPVERATFQANLAKALMSEFPDAYIDTACVGATPADQATAFGVWLTPPASEEQRKQHHRGLTELGGRTPSQTISFFLNGRLFRDLTATAWNDPGMYKRLDDNGIPQLDGPVHLTDLKVSMQPPDTLVTTVSGFDDRPWPDADFTLTIAEAYKVDQFAGTLNYTPTQTLDIDTGFSTVLAAALALTVFASGWFALPFMLAVYQTVKLHQAEEEGVDDQKGAGSTVTDHFLLPAIPIPGKKKLPISYLGNVEVRSYGLFAGGLLLPEVPRTPSIALVGPRSIKAAAGQGLVKGHYHAEVDDLLGPVVYTWTSDGEVIGEGAKVTVHFDTPPPGKTDRRHVTVTATDSDGMVVSETRKVRISSQSHQGPGGGGHGPGGGGHGGGGHNPPQEP